MTITAEGTITAQPHAGILAHAYEVHGKTILYRLAIRDNPGIRHAVDDLLDATSTYDALNEQPHPPRRVSGRTWSTRTRHTPSDWTGLLRQ